MAMTIGQLSENFESNMPGRIATLRKMTEAMTDPATGPEVVINVRRAAHDLQGQGATFGYPLIGELAQSITTLLRGVDVVTNEQHHLTTVLVDMMDVVIDNKIKGSGGEIGDALRDNVRQLVGKLSSSSG